METPSLNYFKHIVVVVFSNMDLTEDKVRTYWPANICLLVMSVMPVPG